MNAVSGGVHCIASALASLVTVSIFLFLSIYGHALPQPDDDGGMYFFMVLNSQYSLNSL